MIHRRAWFRCWALAALPMAPRLQAQQKLAVVGVLNVGTRPPPDERAKNGFYAGMRELGWEEGKTFRMETAYSESRVDRLPELAAALMAK